MFLKEKELQVLRMQCYHFEVIRKEKKLFSFSSTVNSFYSRHCRDLELLSSLARVRYSGNLFQSNICKIMRRARKRGPQSASLFPFPPYLHPPIPPSPTPISYILWFRKSQKTFCDLFTFLRQRIYSSLKGSSVLR